MSLGPVPRLTAADTNLSSEGAEFLVLGHLLIRGIHATKAYTRYPGWDILACDPETGRTSRIQVKSRLATDYDRSFSIKNFDADFVIHVALNRGYRGAKANKVADTGDTGERPVEYFVIPMTAVREAAEHGVLGPRGYRVTGHRMIPDWERYCDAWHLIADHLGIDASR